MASLLGIPVLILIVMVQIAIVRTLPLLQGTADLVLLVIAAWALQDKGNAGFVWAIIAGVLVGFISSVPWFIPLIAYLAVAFLATYLRRQVWQTPILAMFITSLLGTILLYGMEWVILQVQGVPLPFEESINLVVLPGAFLNLLFALPVYALVTDLTQSAFPEEVVT